MLYDWSSMQLNCTLIRNLNWWRIWYTNYLVSIRRKFLMIVSIDVAVMGQRRQGFDFKWLEIGWRLKWGEPRYHTLSPSRPFCCLRNPLSLPLTGHIYSFRHVTFCTQKKRKHKKEIILILRNDLFHSDLAWTSCLHSKSSAMIWLRNLSHDFKARTGTRWRHLHPEIQRKMY